MPALDIVKAAPPAGKALPAIAHGPRDRGPNQRYS